MDTQEVYKLKEQAENQIKHILEDLQKQTTALDVDIDLRKVQVIMNNRMLTENFVVQLELKF